MCVCLDIGARFPHSLPAAALIISMKKSGEGGSDVSCVAPLIDSICERFAAPSWKQRPRVRALRVDGSGVKHEVSLVEPTLQRVRGARATATGGAADVAGGQRM